MELMRSKSHRTRTVENVEIVEPCTSHQLTFIIQPEVDNWTPPRRDIVNLNQIKRSTVHKYYLNN